MNERMLTYVLHEAQEGIHIMARDKSALHVFNYGTDPQGIEWCFVMAIVPKSVVDKWPLSDSKPFSGQEVD